MKKLQMGFILLLVMSLFATAALAEAPVEITIWTGSRSDLAIREARLAAFNEANPDMHVSMEVFTDNYAAALDLAFEANQMPDIFQVDQNVLYYVERGMIAPISDYLTPEHAQRYGDLLTVDTVNTVDGVQYTLADRGITYRLLYNKDIFAACGITAPPSNLDELYEDAKIITEWGKEKGIYGIAMQLKTPASVGERVIDQIAHRSSLSPYDYATGKYDFSVMKPIVETFRKLYDEGVMFPGIEGLDIDTLRTQFAAGNIGMYMNGNWEISIYAENGQFPAQNDWDAVAMPAISAGSTLGRTDIRNAGRSWGIASSSAHPEYAWRYIDYMLSDEYLIQYHEEGYGTVIVPSAAGKAASPAKKGAEGFKASDALDVIWPVHPENAGMLYEGQSAYNVYADIILGAADTDEALADLTQRYNQGLDDSVNNGYCTRIINTTFKP